MDETQAKELVTVNDDGFWKMDTDTFVPKPKGTLKIKGIEYPIFSFLDIELEDSFRVTDLSIEADDEEGFKGMIDRGIEQIMILNKPGSPTLTPEVFKGMAPRQVIMLTVLATRTGGVPLKAVPSVNSDGNNSPSPSPVAAVSTDGASPATTSA